MIPATEYNKRQRHNFCIAKILIAMGCPVFPCDTETKSPLIPGWKYRDTHISAEQRNAIREEFIARNGFKPFHVGSTLSNATLLRFLREFPDAVYGIPCGLAGVAVVDADQKHDGPRLLAEFIEVHGGWPEGVITIPTRDGGQHHYFINDADLTNSAGGMKAFGCDIRGNNGLCIAPASWRKDGKTYGTLDDLVGFAKAYKAKLLVPMPDFMKAKIGQAVSGSIPNPNANNEVTATLKELRALGMAGGGDDDLAEQIGAQALTPWFQHYCANTRWGEDATSSAYRFRYLQMVRAMLPELSAGEGFSILCYASDNDLEEVGEYVGDRTKGKDETGVFTLANFARDWNRAKYSKFNPGLPANGEAFGVAEEL